MFFIGLKAAKVKFHFVDWFSQFKDHPLVDIHIATPIVLNMKINKWIVKLDKLKGKRMRQQHKRQQKFSVAALTVNDRHFNTRTYRKQQEGF